MDEESRNIEAWKNDAMSDTRDRLAKGAAGENEKNRLWWEALPMTYEDWGSGDREPHTKEDFEKVDRHYFRTNPYLETHVDWAGFRGKRVLEIGCGAGSATCRFASEGASVQAVDITANAVTLTRRHVEVCGIKDVRVTQIDAEDLSQLEDGTFDFVYSWGVMHHSAHPERCFREAAKKVRPGGSGLIMVYHRNSLRYRVRGAAYLLLKGKLLKGDNWETVQRHYTDGFYHKHYTRKTLAVAMEEAGFTVEKIDVCHMSSRMVPWIPERLRQWLKSKFGWLIVARVRRP